MKLRQKIAVASAMLLAAMGALVAPTAYAAGPTYYYPVEHYQVCQHQGHFGATTFAPWDPNGMVCYDLAFPFGFSLAEGLDYQGFCSWKYPGSNAENISGDVWGWKCVRQEAAG